VWRARGASENDEKETLFFPPYETRASCIISLQILHHHSAFFFNHDSDEFCEFTRRRATRVQPIARDDAYWRPRAHGGC
jgi:hypothetical protein